MTRDVIPNNQLNLRQPEIREFDLNPQELDQVQQAFYQDQPEQEIFLEENRDLFKSGLASGFCLTLCGFGSIVSSLVTSEAMFFPYLFYTIGGLLVTSGSFVCFCTCYLCNFNNNSRILVENRNDNAHSIQLNTFPTPQQNVEQSANVVAES